MGFGDTSNKDKKKAAAAAGAAVAAAAAEDASWEDNDKGNKAKASRAAAKSEAADEKLRRKAENKELEEAENASMSKVKGANKGSTKVTQAEIMRRQALLAATKAAPKKGYPGKTVVEKAPEIQPNMNRTGDDIDATGVDAALKALERTTSTISTTKMSYKEFEERELDGIKADNPGLKINQAKDKCWKMWERSSDNPKNQKES